MGVRQTSPLIAAEALGYVTSISLWGFFLSALSVSRPSLPAIVKLLSSAYILYLAARIWRQSGALQHVAANPVGLRDMFVTTLMNPKALLFGSTFFPLAAFQTAADFGRTMATFLVVLVPIAIGWSYLGMLLTARRSWASHTPKLLRGAALVLLTFSGTLMYSVLSR